MGVLNPVVRFVLRVISPIYRPGAQEKVVEFHHPRSGSTVLASMLEDHPEVYWGAELLGKHVLRDIDRTSFDYKKYLKREEFASTRKYFGIEVKFNDVHKLNCSMQDFISHLQSTGYHHFILLERRNLLRRFTSQLVAQQAGFHHMARNQPKVMRKVLAPIQKMIANFEKTSQETTELKALLASIPHLHLFYEEDIEKDPSVAYKKVCAFLKIDPVAIPPKLQRINPYPLKDIIINYDEVVNALRGTKYAWMLEEGGER